MSECSFSSCSTSGAIFISWMFLLQIGSHLVLVAEGEEVETTPVGGLPKALDVVKMMEAAKAVVVEGVELVVKVVVSEVIIH